MKQDLWQPVTIEIIAAIHSHLTNTPLDTAFYACLTILFYTAARVGEFIIHHHNSFNPAENITPAGVRVETDWNNLKTMVFSLPCTKSSLSGEEVQWAMQNGPMNPQAVLNAHMAVNNPPINGPLFTYRDGNKHEIHLH